MKMSKKAIAVIVLSASVSMGAFAYNSGITQGLGFKKNAPEEIVATVTVPNDMEQPNILAYTPPVQEAPPVEKKVEVKAAKPAPKPVAKTTAAKTAAKSTTTLASRGTTAKKTTTTKSAVYTTSAYKVSDAERDLFYRLVSAESSGESLAGKLAVATVIMNRVKSPDFPNTIKGVIYDNKWGVQFTPTADGRINEPATADSKKAVDMVLNGYRSFGPKVLFFMNPSTSVNMYVVNNRTYYTTIGLHKFYY